MHSNMNRDSFVRLCIVSLILVTHFMAARGINCTNDATHYALLRAAVRDHTLCIDRYAAIVSTDGALVNNHWYSPRAPGMAILAAPLYWAAQQVPIFPYPTLTNPSASDRADRGIWALVLISIAAACGVAVLGHRLLRRWGASEGAALVAVLTAIYATPMFKYGTCAFSHGPSAFLALALICSMMALDPKPGRRQMLQAAGCGFLAGWAITMELANLILIPAAFAALWFGGRASGLRLSAAAIAAAIAAGIVGIAPCLVYNTMAFGSPFTTGYKFVVENHAIHQSLASTYSTPFIKGLWGTWIGLVSLTDPYDRNVGLFCRYPVLLFAMVGLAIGIARPASRPAALSLAAIVAVYTIHYSKYFLLGGGSMDSRFLTGAAVATALGLAFTCDAIEERLRPPAREFVRMLMLSSLGISVYLGALSLANSLGYWWKYEDTQRIPNYGGKTYEMFGSAGNWKLLFRELFPNSANVAWILPWVALVWIVALVWARCTPAREGSSKPAPNSTRRRAA